MESLSWWVCNSLRLFTESLWRTKSAVRRARGLVCWLAASRPCDVLVCLWGGYTRTVVRAAILRQK